jgi:hypothetical protein
VRTVQDSRSSELPPVVDRFVRVVNWLDEARWRGAPDLFSNPVYDSLDASKKLLVHWLCYITNRQRPFRQVWDEGGFVFSMVVASYPRLVAPSGGVRQLLQRHQSKGKGQLPAYRASYGGREVTYAPRYGADHESIERTLDLLCDYSGSLTTFISHFIARFRAEPEGLRRLAHSLDLLSYRREVPLHEARSLLRSDAALARDFRAWKRSSTEHHKRLWASLRDYRKPGSPFHRYLEAQVKWPHSGFELNQLELPGDVWNVRFSQRLVGRIDLAVGLNASPAKASKTARRLFDRIARLDPDTSFYPERLDFSFDFTPRMCQQDMCDVCLLSEPAGLLCPGQAAQQVSALCPVLLRACGYRQKCVVAGCPVAAGICYGLCGGQ